MSDAPPAGPPEQTPPPQQPPASGQQPSYPPAGYPQAGPPPAGQWPAQPGYGGYPPAGQWPAQPGYGYPPYYDPAAKSKVVAGLLGILVGGFGVHRFYLGYTSIGIAQIAVTILTCGLGAIWGLVEGVMILVGSEQFRVDATGRPLRD